MAQRNRRRARGGGGPRPRRNGPGANGKPDAGSSRDAEHPFPELVSGEEALEEAQVAFGRPAPPETPAETELDAFAGGGSAPELTPKVGLPAQLIGFFIGAWRELQRVQWPDRRQVFQATGVVLGFVVVAGAFLAVASLAAQKVVSLILYGHG